MSAYESSKLWQQGLAKRDDQYDKARQRLRSGFEAFRERVSALAGTIQVDLPSLTVHDIQHIDSLWTMAELIIGDEVLNRTEPLLNPLETFVLGAAFLVHDLGHSRLSLPISDMDLHADSEYQDLLADVLRARHGESYDPVSGTLSDFDDHKVALAEYLRANHAKTAMALPLTAWSGNNGRAEYLITDPELRDALGEAIGKVAASHHWQVQMLPDKFGIMGAPAFLPHHWNCDLLKIACLLRLSDAAHIDAGRAPIFIGALRKPTAIAKHHWDFQQRVHQPVRIGDRLQYTSGSSFPLELVDAWWLCYDTLNMIDKELSEVDSMLADAARHRFAVRSVAGVEDPKRLAKLVPTVGWSPVDTQIKVGNVAALVSRLGGKQLYGENCLAPLRELIQNSGDAVRARRVLEDHDESWGSVDVSIFERDGRWKLKISDNGTGMSEAVLTGSLLDFGSSFWRSAEASKEFPGLKATSFEPTGRYGIGFFSVFMLATEVKIISRRYDLGMMETRVLEFRDGVNSRPLLRAADTDERKICGTQVEILLKNNPYKTGGLLKSESHEIPHLSLNETIAWLCPCFETDIRTSEKNGPWVTAITANDWKSLSPEKLLLRVEKVNSGNPRSAKGI